MDVQLTTSPYTSATDWTLNSTAGGGAACKGTAPLNSFYGTTMASHRSFGCFQEASGGGSVTNIFTHPRKLVIVPSSRPPRRPGVVIPAAAVPLLLPARRRSYPVPSPVIRPRATAVVAAPPVVTVVKTPPRTLSRQLVIRRNLAAILPGPTVQTLVPIRMPPRMIVRVAQVRRNAGQSLFATAAAAAHTTVLVTSPRRVM